MQKIRPFEAIASRFNVSNESAKYFLLHVQKSFKTVRPAQQLIVDFMSVKKYPILPKPHFVASQLKDEGIWVHPMYAPPVELEDEEDIYF